MEFGLKESDLKYIISILKRYPEIKKATIFGSRAKGTYKNGSDVDIAIYGKEVDFNIVSKVHYLLEETGPLPYLFDVIDYDHLEHKELKEHIDRVCKVIYEV